MGALITERAPPPPEGGREPDISPHLLRWSRLLDESIRVPGTSRRIGLDGILGLIPVVGDAVTGLSAIAMLREADRLGVPKLHRFRMVGNYLIDLAVGAIPLVGDLFDLGFKANMRNLEILRRHARRRGGGR